MFWDTHHVMVILYIGTSLGVHRVWDISILGVHHGEVDHRRWLVEHHRGLMVDNRWSVKHH